MYVDLYFCVYACVCVRCTHFRIISLPLLQAPDLNLSIHTTDLGDGPIAMSSADVQAISPVSINAGAVPAPLSNLPEGLRPQSSGRVCVAGKVSVDRQVLEAGTGTKICKDGVLTTDRIETTGYDVST